MMRRSSGDPLPDQPFWRQRGWITSALFLAIVAVVGSVAAFVAGGQVDEPLPAGPLSAVGAGESRPAGCRTQDDDQTTPVAGPADTRWEKLNGSHVPVSVSAGPVRATGVIRWCFAHTPLGAVMAAHVIPRQMSGREWRIVADQQLVPGAPRDLFVALRSTVADTAPQTVSSTFAGFQVLDYTPQAATVRLLIQAGASVYRSTDVAVAWNGGDWKVRVSSGGAVYTPLQPDPGPAGYVMWKVPHA